MLLFPEDVSHYIPSHCPITPVLSFLFSCPIAQVPKMQSATVSRILYALLLAWHDDHSSKRPIPRTDTAGAEWCGPHLVLYLVLHRKGFALPPRSPNEAVGSYPTFSPWPRLAGVRRHLRVGVVCFLWHFPFRDICFAASGFATGLPALWCPDFPPRQAERPSVADCRHNLMPLVLNTIVGAANNGRRHHCQWLNFTSCCLW